MQPNELPTRRLPADAGEGVERLAHEVNRLNGQVAALLVYIEALGVRPDKPRGDALDAAHDALPPIHLPPGPNTIADHADIVLARLYAKRSD